MNKAWEFYVSPRMHQAFVSLFRSLPCIVAQTPQISMPNTGEFEMEKVFSYWDKVRTVPRCPSSQLCSLTTFKRKKTLKA